MAVVAACGTPARGRLSRAGWNVISGSSLPGLPSTPTDWRADGRRLVQEVASTWSRKYIFTIRDGDLHDGMYHYECLFSLPTNERPVPGIVVAVLFAFLRPALGNGPRLFYSFEESDLRHEWSIVSDGKGGWQAQRGQQQKLSLKGASFEGFLDFYIREKDKVRSSGVDVSTAFERSRFAPPPACDRDEASETGSSFAEAPGAPLLMRQASHLSTASARKASKLSQAQLEAQAAEQAAQEALAREREEMAATMTAALRAANMHCSLVAPPASLSELLTCIFDAADEDGTGMMGHYEVARLMMATLPGFGLQAWDISLLLSRAKEDDEGFINLAEFTKLAPGVIQELKQQRDIFTRIFLPGAFVPIESVRHCFEDELRLTADELMKAFEAKAMEDPTRGHFICSGGHGPEGDEDADRPEANEKRVLVALKRKHCRDAMAQLSERISPQEGSIVLQMLPEDENGFLNIEGLVESFEIIRTESLMNSVVGNDLRALRIHLVERARAAGVDCTGLLKVWKVKDILLTLDRVCLSRLQIHTLLCLCDPSRNGDVDVGDFLHICAAIIPHMTNAHVFTETAEKIMLEHAEAAKERQNAELAALSAVKVAKTDTEAEEADKAPEKQVDRETVERTLLQSFALLDKTQKLTPTLPPEAIFNCVFNGSDQQVQGLCLDELEVVGLMAEMVVDGSGEVPYHDLVRRWVPTMFELRAHPLLSKYLGTNAMEELGIPEPDRHATEAAMPLLTPEMMKPSTPLVTEIAAAFEQQVCVVRRMGSKTGPRRRGTLSQRPTLESDAGDAEARAVSKKKEEMPPPGRGFMRRKARMDQENSVKEEASLDERLVRSGGSP